MKEKGAESGKETGRKMDEEPYLPVPPASTCLSFLRQTFPEKKDCLLERRGWGEEGDVPAPLRPWG